MAKWKMPPKAKIYEALSAVADKRIEIKTSQAAEVKSSSGNKIYSVQWTEDFQTFVSNDNASYWQGYLGYPIIAVLIALKKLSCSLEIANQLAGVEWKKINDEHKRDYEKAIESVLKNIETRGGDRGAIIDQVDTIYKELEKMAIERGRQGKKPPKG